MSNIGVLKLRKAAQEDVPTYRAYLIGADNRIFAAHIIDARSDDEAAAGARALAGPLSAEVWERSRRIARFDPEPPSVTASVAIRRT
ncbi:hypothetical protein [Methylobacterium frigidaeris]|uniref:hypothetical protein n=1 Tax=Methylobacterium frigidaeris TaxID=2038277 RepID=UPI001EE05BE8|nr:hypothetical protein [Methylobacterium frigidaeris]